MVCCAKNALFQQEFLIIFFYSWKTRIISIGNNSPLAYIPYITTQTCCNLRGRSATWTRTQRALWTVAGVWLVCTPRRLHTNFLSMAYYTKCYIWLWPYRCMCPGHTWPVLTAGVLLFIASNSSVVRQMPSKPAMAIRSICFGSVVCCSDIANVLTVVLT